MIITEAITEVLRNILKQTKNIQLTRYMKCKCLFKNSASNIQNNNYLQGKPLKTFFLEYSMEIYSAVYLETAGRISDDPQMNLHTKGMIKNLARIHE